METTRVTEHFAACAESDAKHCACCVMLREAGAAGQRARVGVDHAAVALQVDRARIAHGGHHRRGPAWFAMATVSSARRTA
jgi:hypothetical protein